MNWFAEPPLPSPCGCGKGRGQPCEELGLNNHINFSPFAYLQDEDDIDNGYYAAAKEGNYYSPIRHWAIVGQIKSFPSIHPALRFRPRVQLVTRYGEVVPTHFYLEDSTTPSFFDRKHLIEGNTMIILYPKRHQFRDFTVGIRQENANTVMIFPVSHEVLTQEYDLLIDQNPVCCFNCRQRFEQLKRCSRCQLAHYCSQDCQVDHWKTSHKKLCRHMPKISALTKLNFSTFNGFFNWGTLNEEQLLHEEQEKLNKEAIHDFMRDRLGVSTPQVLLGFMESLANVVLESDDIGKHVMGTQHVERTAERMRELNCQSDFEFTSPLSNNSLYQALKCLAIECSESNNKKDRCFVADVKSNNLVTDTHNDVFLSTFFLSLPQWQLQNGIKGIYWSFETHTLFNQDLIFPTSSWKITTGSESMTVTNQHAQAFYHDDASTVVQIANEMAERNRNSLIVRVLRATGASHYTKEIVNASTPKNIITLWIREDLVSLGATFNDQPRDNYPSLVAQLTDYKHLSLIQRIIPNIQLMNGFAKEA